MKKHILFISCEEAKHICDKSQYGEASMWDKFKLNLRLSWCKVTRAYTKRNRKLTKVMESGEAHFLNDQERSQIAEKFNEELAKR